MNINTLGKVLATFFLVFSGIVWGGIGILGIIAGFITFGVTSPFLSVFFIVAGGVFLVGGLLNLTNLRA